MPTQQRVDKLTAAANARQQGVVVIEDVYDPHNAQAVFRSCDAFGIQRVCLIFDKQKPFNPKKIGKQSSSSANKWLDFEVYSSTKECLGKLKEEGYEIVATVLDDTSESLYSARFDNPKTALLLGNEHAGLTEEAISLADRKVIIPMKGMVQSFNLSVTASIFMFELTRQRMEKGMEQYILPEEERTALVEDFLER